VALQIAFAQYWHYTNSLPQKDITTAPCLKEALPKIIA